MTCGHPGMTAGRTAARDRRPAALLGRDWLRESLLFAGAYLAYEILRTLGTGSPAQALEDARRVAGAERALGLAVEGRVQEALEGTLWLDLLDWVYIAAQSVVLAAAIVLVYRRSRPVYRALRTTMLCAWLIALPVYALFPTAPPRLADMGIADSVSASTPVALDAPSVAALYNPYAAVPSLHAAFAVALGVALAACLGHWAARLAALAWGPLVSLAVVATGNHFVIDIAAGLGVTIAGFAVACATQPATRRAVARPLRRTTASSFTPRAARPGR